MHNGIRTNIYQTYGNSISPNRHQTVDSSGDIHPLELVMPDFPVPEYSRKEIREAGKLLSTVIRASDATSEKVLKAFQIAHNWRLSHARPMYIERQRLARIAKVGIVTAGRVKRMTSIRRKLMRGSTDLKSMQDLGGCRAVMRNIEEVNFVLNAYTGGNSRSTLKRVSDYIENPKPDGYRGIHLICEFQSDHAPIYNGQNLEIQVRTANQHIWATAIETVGAMRNEDLKSGKGDALWLRLMALMGHYIALKDMLPLHGDFSNRQQLCAEIAELARECNAVAELETFQAIVRRGEELFDDTGVIYELSFDARTGRIEARSQSILRPNFPDFGLESENNQHVIVSVDKFKDLLMAFPNFYLDIDSFMRDLRQALSEVPIQYFIAPQPTIRAEPNYKIDTSFLHHTGKIKRP